MFDPTIFDNLKVVLEGELYDLDLDGVISITDRKDIVDLATMSRHYQCSFSFKKAQSDITTTVHLRASSNDLYGEILELNKTIGASLEIEFTIPIKNVEHEPMIIETTIKDTWNHRPIIEQRISYDWNEPTTYKTVASLSFNRSINEDQISDLHAVINVIIQTVENVGRSLKRCL